MKYMHGSNACTYSTSTYCYCRVSVLQLISLHYCTATHTSHHTLYYTHSRCPALSLLKHHIKGIPLNNESQLNQCHLPLVIFSICVAFHRCVTIRLIGCVRLRLSAMKSRRSVEATKWRSLLFKLTMFVDRCCRMLGCVLRSKATQQITRPLTLRV